MNDIKRRLWSFCASDDAEFLKGGFIAVDRRDLGDLSVFPAEREAFRAQYETLCGGEGFGKTVEQNALYRFVREMSVGDYVLLRTAHDQPVELGRVTGAYAFAGEDEPYPHRRSVRWLRRLSPEDISSGALREISYASASPLFPVTHYAGEFFARLGMAETGEARAESGEERSLRDFVLRELRCRPAYHGCKEFVAGLLQAMGYGVTILSRNDGVDLVARRDELMPRVLVQVRDCADAADAAALRRNLKAGEYGMLFTLCECSPELRDALNASGLRGVDGAELTRLTLRYYDALNESCRKMIPLKTVLVPVA